LFSINLKVLLIFCCKINVFLRQFCNYTLFINKDLDSRGGLETVFAVLPAGIPEEKFSVGQDLKFCSAREFFF